MCTVTYIPTGNDNFIFTSNRDEAPKRSAVGISKMTLGKKIITFPKDAKANGTWIAISDSNQLVCVLNGAFVKHKHLPPYRLSRGIMALDFFSCASAEDFFNQYNLEGIEPFTLVIFDNGRLFELRWDEQEKHVKELATTENHLWASCTLYNEEWQRKRKKWFQDWQNKYAEPNQEAVLDFHKNAGEGNSEFDVVMNYKNIVRTTSVTSVVKKEDGMDLRYEDLLNGEVRFSEIGIR